jgi:hypothetical protein
MAPGPCTSKGEAKVLLCCPISHGLLLERDRLRAGQGHGPQGRSQRRMEERIALHLAAQEEA